MATVSLIGLHIGKHIFHLAGRDHRGNPVLKKQFSRSRLIDFLAQFPACRIVMEACCGAHWLARKLSGFGHTVQLIAPQYIRPFVTGNKNDFLDAQAICEAASRPTMRYVAPKTPEQQALSALHRWQGAIAHWTVALMQRRHSNIVACALANKLARVVWALLANGGEYRPQPRAALEMQTAGTNPAA